MKKIIISVILILLVGFSLFLFFRRDEEKTELKKIRVAEVTHSLFYTPQYITHKLGYFKDEGLDVEFILTPGVKSLYVFLIFLLFTCFYLLCFFFYLFY